MKRKIIYSIITILVVIVITGCEKELKKGEKVVAKVSDYKVTADDLYNEMKEKYAVKILINKIDHELMDTKFKTDDKEEEEIDNKVKQLKESYSVTTDDEINSIIKQLYGLENEHELRDMLSLNYKRDLAIKDYVATKVVTDDEVTEYYDAKIIGEVDVKHILISPSASEEDSDEVKEQKEAEAKKKAEDIIKKLDNGESFDSLAKKYSDDKATASKGGSIGKFTSTDNLEDSIVQALASLKKGKYTKEPVKTTYGYEIILKVSEKDKQQKADIEKDIRNAIAQDKIDADNSSSAYYKRLKAFREANGLKFSDSSMEKLYNEYMDSLIGTDSNN